MDDVFHIYTDRLKGGNTEKIDEVVPSDFLEVHESDLTFKESIRFHGSAYLAEGDLILHLDVYATAIIPCAICGVPVETKVAVENLYHMEPLESLKGGVFQFQNVLREAILLDTPQFAECCGGKCPQRKEIAKYLTQEGDKEKKLEKEGHYHPFEDVNWDEFKS